MTAPRPHRPRRPHRGLRAVSLALCLAPLVACAPADPPPPLDPAPVRQERTARLVAEPLLAPLLENLVPTFRDRAGGADLVLEAPLAAPGAERALADGWVDAAVVLWPADAPAPPHGERVARTRPLWLAGPGLRLRHLTPDELAAGLRGRLRDAEGQPIRFVAGEDADPRLRAFAATAAEVGAAIAERRAEAGTEDPRSLLRPPPRHLALADTGLVALLGVPAWPVRYGLPVVPLDVWIVHGPAPPPQVQALCAFLRSPDGRDQVVDLGYDLPPSPR